MLAYIILYVILSLAAGHIGEILWGSIRHEARAGLFDSKTAACKVLYGVLGLGAIASQGAMGVFAVLAGLPVCLAHLSLMKRDPARQLTGIMIAGQVWERAKNCFREFMNRSRLIGRK